MRAKQLIIIRMGGLCGIICPVIGLSVFLITASRSPWFSWTENYLSVLGVEGSATTLFNSGLIVVGIISFFFALGIRNSTLLNSRLGQIGIISLALGSIAISLMGIFPRTIDIPHNSASIAFYVFIPLSQFLIGVAIMTSPEKWWGLSSLGAGILTVILVLAPWPLNGGAILQTISCLPWLLWSLVFGGRLLIKPE